jgi:hypothetical protein
MRSFKWAVAAVAATSVLGCGNQPSIYRVAVQRLTQESVPTSCYRSGQAPTSNPDKATNLIDQQQWVFWEGVEDAAYLEAGTISYTLGQAQRINIAADAIQGAKVDGKYQFVTERTEIDGPGETYTTSATYNFEKLGGTVEGTLALHSHCTGTACSDTPSCDVTLTFSGIKIDADQLSLYTANPGT